MRALTYRVTLREPLLATTLDGEPNSAVSADYLPGSALRGLLIGEYLRQRGSASIDSADPDFRRLFLDGSTRFLNGYLLDAQARRSLPVPLSWYRAKGTSTPVYDRAVDPAASGAELQGIGAGFHQAFDADDDQPRVAIFHPQRRVAIHIARGPGGRPTRGDGTVFRYDALAPDQRFGAVILGDTADDLATLAEILRGLDSVQIGRSRSAGYGGAEIEAGSVELIEGWSEADAQEEWEAGSPLVLTLLSDTLLRDSFGHPTADPSALTAALQSHLGTDLRLQRAFARARIVGGFNRTWGLPLPQAPALAMGSVLTFDCPTSAAAALRQRLRELEERGLGERRAEGFGRVIFNWYDTEQWDHVESGAKVEDSAGPPGLSESSTLLARRMVGRILQARLERGLVQHSQDLATGARRYPIPSRAQLGRLRAILRDCLAWPADDARNRLTRYVADLKRRPTSRAQFGRARVGGQPFLEWLEETITDSTKTWSFLIEKSASHRLPTIGPVTAVADSDLAFRSTLDMIDRVLAHLQKPSVNPGASAPDQGENRHV